MKIWIVGRGYPTPANKMWGSFELEQAKLLARNGNEVSYIALTLSFFDREDPRGMRFFEEDGVEVFLYSHFYFPGKLGVNWERFEDNCWRKLYSTAQKKTGKPDIIHIHYPSMLGGMKVVDEYKKQKIKIIVTEHWSRVLINTLKGYEVTRLKYYANNANCFICVSELLKEAVKKYTDVTVPMEVVPNIVSPVFLKKVSKQKKRNEFVFICVGRLVSLKQFSIVIKQFIMQFPDNRNVILKIIGSGPEKMKLMKAADGNPRVWFIGGLPLGDVAHEIRNADALISYSKYETFAAPVAEAWGCGKPVIVSDKSGVASYISEDNGILVHNDDFDQLGLAMRNIYENYLHYNAEKISSFAREHFSDEAIWSKLKHIYLR